MLQNHFKTALRHLTRHKGYTLLNVVGLTVGVTCGLLIMLWVIDEMRIDGFHEKDTHLYRMMRNIHLSDGDIITTGAIPQPVKVMLDGEYPEVEAASLVGWEIESVIGHGADIFRETGRYVSPEFFEVFSYQLLAGDAATALSNIDNILISEDVAIKVFGNDWRNMEVLGQTLQFDYRRDFNIAGVFANPGKYSSFDFQWLIPAREYIDRNAWVENWENGGFSLAFTAHPGTDMDEFSRKIELEINNHTDNSADERLWFQRFSEGYLHGNYENGRIAGGRIQYVRLLWIIALFILVIACINFMNLATARATGRAQEIGLRKVMGARKSNLGVQFFSESILIALFSVVLATGLVYLLIPSFNSVTGKAINFDPADGNLWLLIGATAIITGFLSGIYPALMLPSFKITNTLKGTIKHPGGAATFRKALVVFQFAISILLIIGTLAISRQMDYIMTKNLGLDRENLVFVNLEGELGNRFDTYKAELLQIPEVQSVTATSGNPLSYGRSSSSPSWEGKNPDENVEMNILMVRDEFTKTMDMEILEGRDFSEDYSSDSANFLVNEVAAGIMGFENPVGERLSVWGVDGRIVGLLRNFHMSSMHSPIAPLVVRYDPRNIFQAYMRIRGNPQDALLAIEKVTTDLNPTYPFQHFFLDDEYASQYEGEMVISRLSKIFAGMAIFISCLGLFGLSAFSTAQRTREIGIRKVLGASVSRLALLLSRDFTLLVGLSFIVAAPLGYYLTRQWLDQFVFHTTVGIDIFIISGIVALLIAALTVSFKAVQTALANPVHALKEE